MGQRSRRRMRGDGGVTPSPDPTDRLPDRLDSSSGPQQPPSPPQPPGPAEGPSRSARRDEQTRADLVPLAPGERPKAVIVAAVVAGLSGVANLIAFAAGLKIRGRPEAAGGVIAFSVIMLVAAAGMVGLRYWAVLGFQALLALTILAFGINLIKVSSILGLVISVAVVGLGGLLFWRLVQALARIQMPQRR